MREWLLALCLVLGLTAPAMAQTSPREVATLADGWRFLYGELGEAPAAPAFDDAGWEPVSVPHSWNRIGEYREQRSAEANNKQGVGWYRLTFQAAPAAKGKRHYLDFAAVGAIADVWVMQLQPGSSSPKRASASSAARCNTGPPGRRVSSGRAMPPRWAVAAVST